MIKININEIKIPEDELLMPPLLTLSASISEPWSIQFIKRIILFYKPIKNEYSYFYDIAIRSIILTPKWLEFIKEISYEILNFDDNFVVDFIAYFKWKKGENDFKKLISTIGNTELERISLFQERINDRYKSHYLKFTSNADNKV